MKRVTASEARRRWFTLLDEVARGEVVVVERGGRRIIIQRQAESATRGGGLDYSRVLRVPHAEDADSWGWTWRESAPLRQRKTRRVKRAP